MSAAVTSMTTSELLALPDDGTERELIRGNLREREMTRRNRVHAATESLIVYELQSWLQNQTACEACVLSGEAGAILAQNPDTTVGIDVAVFAREVLERQSGESSLVVGLPLLAVEILSPHDKHEDIHEKILEYLRVGVPLVWEVDPDFKTVRVFRPQHDPIMFNRSQHIDGGDVLLEFNVSVAKFFPSWN